ncbi:hypothetical protein GCM10009133_18150 [Cocleimonas flava]
MILGFCCLKTKIEFMLCGGSFLTIMKNNQIFRLESPKQLNKDEVEDGRCTCIYGGEFTYH